eukprot:TRINITY_DN16336_c0_g1_i1.p1 TRINITY_DN16336_c0_g1~~TRINITY_DN16336_c0_g1_i1.p1  ORF type:complete len:601 (+),score=123.58 TRINITY_DN16336_c0_g1_i1:179-1981(+)
MPGTQRFTAFEDIILAFTLRKALLSNQFAHSTIYADLASALCEARGVRHSTSHVRNQVMRLTCHMFDTNGSLMLAAFRDDQQFKAIVSCIVICLLPRGCYPQLRDQADIYSKVEEAQRRAPHLKIDKELFKIPQQQMRVRRRSSDAKEYFQGCMDVVDAPQITTNFASKGVGVHYSPSRSKPQLNQQPNQQPIQSIHIDDSPTESEGDSDEDAFDPRAFESENALDMGAREQHWQGQMVETFKGLCHLAVRSSTPSKVQQVVVFVAEITQASPKEEEIWLGELNRLALLQDSISDTLKYLALAKAVEQGLACRSSDRELDTSRFKARLQSAIENHHLDETLELLREPNTAVLQGEPNDFIKRNMTEAVASGDQARLAFWADVLAQFNNVKVSGLVCPPAPCKPLPTHRAGEDVMAALDRHFMQNSPLLQEGLARKMENARQKRGRCVDPAQSIAQTVSRKAERRSKNAKKKGSTLGVKQLKAYLKAVGLSAKGSKKELSQRWDSRLCTNAATAPDETDSHQRQKKRKLRKKQIILSSSESDSDEEPVSQQGRDQDAEMAEPADAEAADAEPADVEMQQPPEVSACAVSYTHLTLPTKRIV